MITSTVFLRIKITIKKLLKLNNFRKEIRKRKMMMTTTIIIVMTKKRKKRCTKEKHLNF